jgi:quinol monooxygenase YgiN
MIIVTGTVGVDPPDLDTFAADLKVLAEVSRQRTGNLAYAVSRDSADPGRLLVVERWQDQPSLTAHLDAPDTRAFVTRWQGRMRGNIRKYDAANERGVMED